MNSSDKLVTRETDVYSLAQLGQDFLFPERIRVKLDPLTRIAPLDIGAFAYSSRAVVVRAKDAHLPVPVDASTLLVSRRVMIRGIVDDFFSNGRRDTTIVLDYRNFKLVLDWCDSNGHSDWAVSVDSAAQAYSAYSDFLRHSILVGEDIRPATGAERQRALQRLAEFCFPNQSLYVVRGVPMIKATRTPKQPPEEDYIRHYVKVCLDLATHLSDFVLNEKSFPFGFEVGGKAAAFFPSNAGIMGPYTDSSKIPAAYNVVDLRVATRDEILAKWPGYTSAAARARETQLAIDKANADPRYYARKILASLAAGAYSCLFSVITAAGPSEFIQFEYLDALEIERSMVKKEFTSVKFRANGKVTRYAIGRRSGLDLLRAYLKLREWILDGDECKYLFFTMKRSNGDYNGQYGRLDPSFSYKFYKRIVGTFLPEKSKNIPGGVARKLKSLVLHELRVSAKSVADALNHTPATNAKSYTETTSSRQKQEFGTFWQAIRKAADAVRDTDGGETPIAAGHCDAYTRPVKIIETAPIEPNCRTQYGCLFCENYVCHADQEDAHKLLSLQYVAKAVREFSPQVEHAEALFRELTVRIDFILDKVAERSDEHAAMIKSMKKRVHDLGELTPFWESRLQRYEKAGVVF